MARAKKETYRYIPLEERPEFIAAVAALPDDPAELERLAAQYQRIFHAAVLAGHVDVVKAQGDALSAVGVKLNAGVVRGSQGDGSALMAIIERNAPPLGQVPQWGQDGEFLLEVAGIRIRVRARSSSLSVTLHVDLNVVDLDELFVSETGYRSTYIWADRSLGLTVDQAVRQDVEMMLAAKGGKPRMVAPDAHIRGRWEGVPVWLADLLAGVRSDGQLLMGFAGADPVSPAKAPMSNADRQKAFRQRQRELKEQQAAAGVKAISLSHTERCVLSLGVLAHEDLFHRPADWEVSKKPGFDALLAKLWPEGDCGRYLAEPQRSTYRPAAFLRDELEQQRALVQRLKAIQCQGGELAAGELAEARQVPQWEKLTSDFGRAALAIGLLRLRNNQHAELARAVELLQGRLREAGLSDRVSADKKQWYWNEAKPMDYRATSAPEYMERVSAESSKVDEVAELRRQVAALERENALLESERNKAYKAIGTWENRLRAAGQSTDYRPLPGEQGHVTVTNDKD